MNRFIKLFSLLSFSLLICSYLFALPLKPQRKPWSERAIQAHSQSRADSLHGFDVQKYEITLAVDDVQRSIDGNVLATVIATDALSSIQYELNDLDVSQVKVNGMVSGFTHSDGIIHIPVNMVSGEQFSTQVFYSGNPQLSQDVYRVGMIFGNNSVFTISDPDAARQWWPCYDHPWDKAVVDLHITMRSDWKVAANGLRDSIIDNGDGSSTTHWLGEHPMTTYLACITAGPYVEIPQNAGDTPILNFVTSAQYNNALNDLANLPEMILYFNEIFGDYPFEKYGNATVNMSTFGAMEHQTMTTLGNYIINGTGSQELTIAHELAHQWYGNAVSFLSFKDVWLSEGFATYSEHLWVDKTLGWQAACDYVASSYHQYYKSWENSNGHKVIYDPPFNSYFTPPVYEKAASVLHMLRLKMGDDAFFELLQTWFESYKHQNVITSEFITLAEQISDLDLGQFFDQWIFGSGIPSVEYSIWNNADSDTDSSSKIMARSSSPTATQFVVELPFKITHQSVSDSLLVSAGPDWTANHFDQSLSMDMEVSANHNNWALLQQITQLRPKISECLSSNGSVHISWNAFLDELTRGYNLYRKQENSDEWLLVNSQPVQGLSYVDVDVENGSSYEYMLYAVDEQGWQSWASSSVSAHPQAFGFNYMLLVVDETHDGNGNSSIGPTDEMVDDFYDDLLFPLQYSQWDCAAQGMPPLNILGDHKVVLWHADDFSFNLLQDYQNTLSGYILGGGKLILSGWKTAGVLSQSFWDKVAASTIPIYEGSATFSGAHSPHHPDIIMDSSKMLPPWSGMLPYSYSFQNAQNPLYTSNSSQNAAIFRVDQLVGGGALVMSGFPFYFMESSGIRGFLQEIIPELASSSESEETIPSPQKIILNAYPNPFNPQCTISFQLPKAGHTTLKLYNMKGQKVKDIATGHYDVGKQKITLDASELGSGIYIIQIKSSSFSQTKRITLLK